MAATTERWRTAQAYERGFWEGVSTEIGEGRLGHIDFYSWRAERLRRQLRELGLERLTTGGARLIEIGGGPVGILRFLDARERLAVDPLEDSYAGDARLVRFRDPAVTYRRGVGESLPAGDESFDLAIIENCIDHTRDMDEVMREIHRVLVPSGILYLTVNARTWLGFRVHRTLSRLRIDPGHPHTLTPGRTVDLVERGGFRLLDLQVGSYVDAWLGDLRGAGWKPRIKALLGVSEFVVTVFARKEPSGARSSLGA